MNKFLTCLTVLGLLACSASSAFGYDRPDYLNSVTANVGAKFGTIGRTPTPMDAQFNSAIGDLSPKCYESFKSFLSTAGNNLIVKYMKRSAWKISAEITATEPNECLKKMTFIGNPDSIVFSIKIDSFDKDSIHQRLEAELQKSLMDLRRDFRSVESKARIEAIELEAEAKEKIRSK